MTAGRDHRRNQKRGCQGQPGSSHRWIVEGHRRSVDGCRVVSANPLRRGGAGDAPAASARCAIPAFASPPICSVEAMTVRIAGLTMGDMSTRKTRPGFNGSWNSANWPRLAGRALAVLLTLPILGFLVGGWIGALFALVMGLHRRIGGIVDLVDSCLRIARIAQPEGRRREPLTARGRPAAALSVRA